METLPLASILERCPTWRDAPVFSAKCFTSLMLIVFYICSMHNDNSLFSFQNSTPISLYDSHQRLIHPRLYEDFINPNESLHLKKNGIVFPHKNNADFGVIISHDVDHIYGHDKILNPQYRGGLRNISQLLLHDLRSKFSSSPKSQRIRKNEISISRFIEWELKNNIPASYYFLSLHEGEQDFNYRLEEITDIIAGIQQAQGEIALHGGHQSTVDFDTLMKEKNRLESASKLTITGFRSHYLKWAANKTEGFLSKANFQYDTSWGSAQQPGFVKGFCTPHPVWDPVEKSFAPWIEVPLIAMDCSFFDYMKLNENSAWELFIHLVEVVKKCNGILTILWHNSYYKQLPFYWKMLEYLQHQNCHFDTTQEFVNQANRSGYIDELKKFYGQ